MSKALWCCWLGNRKGIRPVKKQSGGVLLSVWSEMQTCIWPSWCHCHSLSLASAIGLTNLVPVHPGSPGKRAIKRVFVLLVVNFEVIFWLTITCSLVRSFCVSKKPLVCGWCWCRRGDAVHWSLQAAVFTAKSWWQTQNAAARAGGTGASYLVDSQCSSLLLSTRAH